MALNKDWVIPIGQIIVRYEIGGPVFALGDQQTYFTELWVRRALRSHGLLRRDATAVPDHVDPTFISAASVMEMLGAEPYSDIDLSGLARIQADLSSPLPPELHGAAGLVLDVGTTEHILDIAAVLKNVVRLVQLGGSVIHVSPVNWLEHGFVNLNPLLFQEFYEYNGFEILESKFIITLLEQAFRDLMTHIGRREWYLHSSWSFPSFCIRTNRYSLRLLNEYLIQPSRMILIFAARKVLDKEPTIPIQGSYSARVRADCAVAVATTLPGRQQARTRPHLSETQSPPTSRAPQPNPGL
jgi:hypothetical protein